MKIDLNHLIPKKYNNFIYDFLNENHSHYALYGGRGSVKSSIAGILLILTLLDKGSAVAVRRYFNSLRGSVFEECKTAALRMGIYDLFEFKVSPLEVVCKINGNKVIFRGLDDPQKIKSSKNSVSNFRMILYEECQEIEEESKTRSVFQTFGRSEHCNILYVFNPPNLKNHWTNTVLRDSSDNRLSLNVNYVDVPKSWLGSQFIEEAERLKTVDIDLYKHEYLGEVAGYKGLVFKNIKDFIADKTQYKTLYRGLDFGFAKDGDPCAYVVCAFDEVKKELYILYEIYLKDSTYPQLTQEILKENVNNFTVRCDSADSGGIKQLRIEGLKKAIGCKKGKVENGVAWLRGLNGIYIDQQSCPHCYEEFSEYMYVLQKSTGDYVLSEKNNHFIDAVRYALSDFIKY